MRRIHAVGADDLPRVVAVDLPDGRRRVEPLPREAGPQDEVRRVVGEEAETALAVTRRPLGSAPPPELADKDAAQQGGESDQTSDRPGNDQRFPPPICEDVRGRARKN